MIIVISAMLIGVGFGFLMRHYRVHWISRIINVFIWALLFMLGVKVGADERIVKGLFSLGAEAIVISLLCTLSSCFAAWVLWKGSRS